MVTERRTKHAGRKVRVAQEYTLDGQPIPVTHELHPMTRLHDFLVQNFLGETVLLKVIPLGDNPSDNRVQEIIPPPGYSPEEAVEDATGYPGELPPRRYRSGDPIEEG